MKLPQILIAVLLSVFGFWLYITFFDSPIDLPSNSRVVNLINISGYSHMKCKTKNVDFEAYIQQKSGFSIKDILEGKHEKLHISKLPREEDYFYGRNNCPAWFRPEDIKNGVMLFNPYFIDGGEILYDYDNELLYYYRKWI